MPIAKDTLSFAATANSRSWSNPVSSGPPPTRKVVPHSSVRGAMRIAGRSGSSVGSWSATSLARCQLVRAARTSR